MLDLSKYELTVRQDFSMVAIEKGFYMRGMPLRPDLPPCRFICLVDGKCTKSAPCQLRDKETKECRKGKPERNNSAEDGYRMSSRSKIKIRSSANALWLGDAERRENLRFVTFTFPPLPEHLESLPLVEQDAELYRLFKKFLNNERRNYGLDKYLWVNERQALNRGVLHFHCLFLYEKKIDYKEANIRFLNLLRRNGFNIFTYDFCLGAYDRRRDGIIERLDKFDYEYFRDGQITSFTRDVVENGFRFEKTSSVFFQPVDFEKPLNDIMQLGYYLSKYISKDDEKELVYCRRWASSRGLFDERDDIFNEFGQADLLEIYTDAPLDVKIMAKAGRVIVPRRFEFTIDDRTYHGYYFMPLFWKWGNDRMMRDYFRSKFGFELTNRSLHSPAKHN